MVKVALALAAMLAQAGAFTPSTVRRASTVMRAHVGAEEEPTTGGSTRRTMFRDLAGMASALALGKANKAVADDAYTLPPLPYAYEALEPAIGSPTMKLHHDKHHQVYITNANKAVAEMSTKPR